MPEPKCWSDLTKPVYKDEIQVANPNSSGTSYTMLATLVQLMGEDKAFDYLKALHKNVNQYTKSGAAPARAAAIGETLIGITFQHDAVVQAIGGAPVTIVSPCEGTGYEIGSMSIIKGAKNMENAKKWYDWALGAEAQSIGAQAKVSYQVPSNKNAQRAAAGAEVLRDQAHQLRFRQVRLVGRAHAPADEVGQGSLDAAEVSMAPATRRLARELARRGRCRARARAGRLRADGARPRDGGRRGGCARRARHRAVVGRRAAPRRWCGRSPATAMFWPLIAASLATLAVRGAGARTRGRHGPRRSRWRGAFGSGFAAGTSGAGVRRRRGAGAPRADRLLRARDRAARRLRRRSDGGDDRRRHRRAAAAVHLLSGRQVAARPPCSTRRAISRPASPPSACSPPTSGRSTASRGGTRCGVAINSALLATIVGVLSTLLGLVLALVVQRGGQRFSGLLKVMSILPIITPPFVIALALVVLFGRTGLITGWLERGVRHSAHALDLRPARRDARAAPVVLADRVHDPARRAGRGESRAGRSGADAARVARRASSAR